MGRLGSLVPLLVAITLGAGSTACTVYRSSPDASKTIMYLCDGATELAVTYVPGDPGSVRVELKGQTWKLPHVIAGSGARYSDGTVTFWNKGRDGMFEAPGTRLSCSEK